MKMYVGFNGHSMFHKLAHRRLRDAEGPGVVLPPLLALSAAEDVREDSA